MHKANMISIADLDRADGGLEMLRLFQGQPGGAVHLDGGAQAAVPLEMGEVMLLANAGTDTRLLDLVSRVLRQGKALLDLRNDAAIERLIDAALEITPMPRPDALLLEAKADYRTRFLQAVPCLTSADVHRIGGAKGRNTSLRATRLKGQGKVFAVRHGAQDFFPAFQFDAQGQPFAILADVLAALPEGWTPWEVAAWFVQKNLGLDGAVPRDLVALEDARLIEAARAAGGQAIG